MKKWQFQKIASNLGSVQATFLKSAVCVPLSTYYKCTNLELAKTLVRNIAQPRINTVKYKNRQVSSSRNKLEMSSMYHHDAR